MSCTFSLNMFTTGSKPADDIYETIPMQYTPSRNQEQVSVTEPMTQENPTYQKHTNNRSGVMEGDRK